MFGPPDQPLAAKSVSVKKTTRVIVPMPPELMKRVKDFRHARQIDSRAEAIRQLIEDGLEANSRQPPRGS
jgi:metal-responsive CopG/Arc/MetJ family transcriptional regulator